jgi:multidrug efflux system membrane fusion protein
MRRGRTQIGLAGIAIALLAAVIAFYWKSDRDQTPEAAAPLPVPVIATTVQRRDMPIILTGLGTVTALNTATIHSQITGLLISVDFKEGQFVKKGDLLAQIDPRTYQAKLDQTEATLSHDQVQLENAQTNLQRYSGLGKENSIALETVSNQQAHVDELMAQINLIRPPSPMPKLSSAIPRCSPRSTVSPDFVCSTSGISSIR